MRSPEDACQEFWIRVLKAKPTGRGYFPGWIWTVAVNNLLSEVDKQAKAPTPVPDIGEDARDPRGRADWEPPSTGALNTALSKLQSSDRTLLLRRANGWSWEEIAVELGVSREAAATRGTRARTHLKREFFRALGQED